MKKHSSIATVAMVAISSFLVTSPALATFHLWEINEIYSNADGTVQYIELFTTFNNQQFTAGNTIRASQGASTHNFVFPGNTSAPTGGHHLLLATADFASLPGAVTPDFTLADGFLFTPNGTVNYIGANSLTYECLPADGIRSLHCDANNGISCTATSVGFNSPTNYAGATGFINAGDGGCTDIDGDGFGSPGNAACPGGAEQDCDNCDAAVFPGAPETTCDSIDNDCDPTTLDDPDNDNDGVGACTDCDDADPNRFPGNTEVSCNAIDDDCDPGTVDCGVPFPADPPNDRLKNRYISFKPENAGGQIKLKVTLTVSLPHPISVGDSWWVQAPVPPGNPLLPPGECLGFLGPENSAAEIDWDAAGCQTLHVTGCPIEPTSEYEVRAGAGANVSAALTVSTALQPGDGKFWGDTVGFFDGVEWTVAQGVSNITDAVVAINTFQGGPVVAPTPGSTIAHLSIADVEPGNINTVVNIADVFILIRAFQGNEYPFGPADAEGNCP